jgi:hypothetical protein
LRKTAILFVERTLAGACCLEWSRPSPTSALCLALMILAGCSSDKVVAPGPASHGFNLVSQTLTPGSAKDVWVVNDTAYVADDEQGVTIWDLSNLSHPVLVDTIPTMSLTNGWTLGQALAVGYSPVTGLLMVRSGGMGGGVAIINRWTKEYQNTIGSKGCVDFRFQEISLDSIIIAEVETDEGYRFGVFINNEFGWWNPYVRNYQPHREMYYGLEMDGNYTYLAQGEFGLTIVQVDYSSPVGDYSVTQLGTVDTPGSARGVALDRNKTHVLVADRYSGLQVIDITDKANPKIVGSILPESVKEVLKVRAVGDTAVFIDNKNGVFAVNASVPRDPVLIGDYRMPAPAGLFIRANDKTIFVADEVLGLLIFSFR